MKFKFNKTNFAVALAVATLFGASAAANAASFVRVPAVAGAQIGNGGLSPAAGGDSTSSESPTPDATLQLSVGSVSLKGTVSASPGYVDTAALPVSAVISGGSGDAGTIAGPVIQTGTLTIKEQKGVVPAIFFSVNDPITGPGTPATGSTRLGLNSTVSPTHALAGMFYRLGVSSGSCANAQWLDQSANGHLHLAPVSTKNGQTYNICVQAPFNPLISDRTYQTGDYSGDHQDLHVGLFAPTTETTTLALSTSGVSQRAFSPSSVTCTVTAARRGSGSNHILTPPDAYDVYATTPDVGPETRAAVSCTNTSDAAVQVGYAVTVAESGVASGSATGDTMNYTVSVTNGTGTITVPANGTASASAQITPSIPAGQDVAVDTYAGNVPVTVTY